MCASAIIQGETRLVMIGGPQDERFKPPFQGDLQRMRRLESYGLCVRVTEYPSDTIPRLRGCITPELLIHSRFLATAIGDAFRLWQKERLILLMRPGWELYAGTDSEMEVLCRYL